MSNKPTSAWWLDEYTIYAARTLNEACATYEADTGVPVDHSYVIALVDNDLDRELPETDEDERPTGAMTTLRRYMNEMIAPGFLAAAGF